MASAASRHVVVNGAPIRVLRLPANEKAFYYGIKVISQFTNKRLWADVAAKLAKMQKVVPGLNDVCHSLLSDGSAFFDGQRFEDWASDLGYSADSIKAKETFESMRPDRSRLGAGAFPRELDGLREWASNY